MIFSLVAFITIFCFKSLKIAMKIIESNFNERLKFHVTYPLYINFPALEINVNFFFFCFKSLRINMKTTESNSLLENVTNYHVKLFFSCFPYLYPKVVIIYYRTSSKYIYGNIFFPMTI